MSARFKRLKEKLCAREELHTHVLVKRCMSMNTTLYANLLAGSEHTHHLLV